MTESERGLGAARPGVYSRVFEFYVSSAEDGEDDLVGLVAYAIYKRLKRDWIIQFRAANHRSPDEAETAAVTQSYLTAEMRLTLRQRAADMLTGYADTFVQAEEPHIRQRAISDETLRQAREIERAIVGRDTLWPQIKAGLMATAIWTVLIVAIAFAAGEFFKEIIAGWIRGS